VTEAAIYAQALTGQLAAMRDVLRRRPMEAMRREVLQTASGAADVRRLAVLDRLDEEVARRLGAAQPIFWGGEPLALLRASWRTVPVWTLRRHDVAADSAFVWFSDPLPLDWAGADSPHIRALLWFRLADESRGASFALMPWSVWPQDGGGATVPGGPSYPLLWPEGRSLPEVEADSGEPRSVYVEPIGRLFATCVALLNQTIVTSEALPADRATRRRAQAELGLPRDEAPPLVRVVLLRRVEPAGGGTPDGGARDAPDWRWRWTVRAHWRKQYYPASGEHRPLLIAAHVKGPADRPLKASTPIWAMTR
jgi:hypothetical protein